MSSPRPNGRRPLPPRKRQARYYATRSGPVAERRVDPRALARQVVQRLACPRCNAPAGEPCTARNGSSRKANHLERVARALDAGT